MIRCEPCGSTKINELQLKIACCSRIFNEHDVFGFYVDVGNANRVQITDAPQQPKDDVLYYIAFAADATPLLVVNVRVQRRMKLFKSNTKVLVPFKIAVNNGTEILAAQFRLKPRDCQRFNFGILKVFGCPAHNLHRNFALMPGIPSFEHASKSSPTNELHIFISVQLADAGVNAAISINGGSRYLSYAR